MTKKNEKIEYVKTEKDLMDEKLTKSGL